MRLWERFLTMVSGDLPPPDDAEHTIARRAYADFLRAQLIGYGRPGCDALLAEIELEPEGEPCVPASFDTLMGVETRLVDLMSDEQIERGYWIVRDRMNRVGSAAAITEHDRHVPPELREDPSGAPSGTPLAIARAARTAALAAVGEAAIALSAREAELAAAPTPTPEQQAAVATARTALSDAIKAADEASKRVTDLEAAEASAAAKQVAVEPPAGQDAAPPEAPAPTDSDAEDAPPPIDAAALIDAADDATAEARLAIATDLAQQPDADADAAPAEPAAPDAQNGETE